MSDIMKKVLDWQQISKTVEGLRQKKKKIVFTNGCFDIIHVGHIRYLRQARALGDALVVGLNSDNSVSLVKGPDRPIIPEEERAEVLAALEFVDYVVIFDEETPTNLIHLVHPDILVKGGDWTIDKIVGREIVEAYGGKVMPLPFHPGKSSSDVIEKVKKL
jgi:rfaE bifunctional protein nucleotidyltransferase chain/domain